MVSVGPRSLNYANTLSTTITRVFAFSSCAVTVVPSLTFSQKRCVRSTNSNWMNTALSKFCDLLSSISSCCLLLSSRHPPLSLSLSSTLFLCLSPSLFLSLDFSISFSLSLSLCMCAYIYILSLCIYIYIYIERDRDKE